MQKQLILFAIFGVFTAIAPAACTRAAAGDRPWVEYDTSSGRLQRIEFYANENGRNLMESVAYYTPDHVVSRVEVSTHRDGKFNRVEYYTNGILDHAEEDTNGDGRVDHWETHRTTASPSGAPVSEVAVASFDDAGRGAPTRRIIYGRDGAVARVETVPDGDGRFDGVDTATTIQARR